MHWSIVCVILILLQCTKLVFKKGFDKNELHQLINSALLQDPYLYKEFPAAWQETYKYLTAQTQMVYKLFFGDYDSFEFEHQAMCLCILHDNLSADLERLTL